MKPKLHLLVFDPYKTNPTALHSVITSMPGKVDWWHYIGSAYIIASHDTAYKISEYINSHWKGNFLITEISSHDHGGWLPKAAWDWINSKR